MNRNYIAEELWEGVTRITLPASPDKSLCAARLSDALSYIPSGYITAD